MHLKDNMPRKNIFLMGAPLSNQLDWDEDGLLNTPTPPFQDSHAHDEQQQSLDQPPVKWRVLQPLSAYAVKSPEVPLFLNTNHLDAIHNNAFRADQEDSVLSDFYEHSVAVHETSEISISGMRTEDSMQESALCTISLETSGSTSSGGEAEALDPLRLPRILGPLTDLQDLPSARFLDSIAPQTMTVNLLVGVLAVHPRRRVVTRQWKREMDIVELVVGDETRAGFTVSFWLPPEKPVNEEDRLSRSLATLRARDIVLLRTVGLSSFRDRVYGQSLRRGMTTLDLLHRRLVDVTDAGGFYDAPRDPRDSNAPIDLSLQKVGRVREWVLRFVGATDGAGGDAPGMPGVQQRGRLPPDTQ
ncbi:hypothetical protein N7510_008861 [Penicillium lagena]|uniref:uncharacterized protein n=1 Tax=Penicillium lagena TaxID=94218 RepID=UPI00253F8B9C|nr:uncharacterized protein N7510_008861 [Penicillium lagena]KAJ5606080.1 hypothetical protein N7510_008861 [Penicillium lagena]